MVRLGSYFALLFVGGLVGVIFFTGSERSFRNSLQRVLFNSAIVYLGKGGAVYASGGRYFQGSVFVRDAVARLNSFRSVSAIVNLPYADLKIRACRSLINARPGVTLIILWGSICDIVWGWIHFRVWKVVLFGVRRPQTDSWPVAFYIFMGDGGIIDYLATCGAIGAVQGRFPYLCVRTMYATAAVTGPGCKIIFLVEDGRVIQDRAPIVGGDAKDEFCDEDDDEDVGSGFCGTFACYECPWNHVVQLFCEVRVLRFFSVNGSERFFWLPTWMQVVVGSVFNSSPRFVFMSKDGAVSKVVYRHAVV